MDSASELRANIARLPDYKVRELREWLCTIANVERVVDHRTKEPNVLDIVELQEFGSEFLAALDGTHEYADDHTMTVRPEARA